MPQIPLHPIIMPSKGTIKWALLAAFLTALSTPPVKVLSSEETPFLLAGLFYLGSILAIVPSILFRMNRYDERSPSTSPDGEWSRRGSNVLVPASASSREVMIAIASVVIGGGIAPILLIWGFEHYPASLGSLLMNAEGIITVLLSWILFREPINKKLSIGAILVAAGCAVVSAGDHTRGFSGALPFFLAAGLWALDSNLLRLLSQWDPLTITLWKGLGSSAILLPLGLWLDHPPLGIAVVMEAIATGTMGYGLSLILFIRSIRSIGVSATGAWFSLSPFLGAFLSILLLGEPLTTTFYVASALLLIAVLFLNAPSVHQKTSDTL